MVRHLLIKVPVCVRAFINASVLVCVFILMSANAPRASATVMSAIYYLLLL